MLNRLTFVLLLLCFSSQLQAQFGYGKIEDIETIKKSPLLVVTQSLIEKQEKKLAKKPDELKQCQENMALFNANLKLGIEKNWNYSKEIIFITEKELETYNKNSKGKYAYMRNDIIAGKDGSSIMTNKNLISTSNYAIYITGENSPVYSMMYFSGVPNEADFKFIVNQIQAYFKGRIDKKASNKSNKQIKEEIASNSKRIKDKTLLLESDDLSDDVKKEIAKIYKFPYKITTKNEIDQAILSNDKTVAYLRIVPVGQVSGNSGAVSVSKLLFVQYFYDSETNDILGMILPSAFGLGGVAGTLTKDSKGKLNLKDFKALIKDIEK